LPVHFLCHLGSEPLGVCVVWCNSQKQALGNRPTMENKHLWATDNILTADQKEVLDLLLEERFTAATHDTVTIGREHFHIATPDKVTNILTSTMGSSHLKANFVTTCRTGAADPNPVDTLMSRYGLLKEILQLDVPKKTVLLNVLWYRQEHAEKNLVTGNVHVKLDHPFEVTLECMIEPGSIENMVVFFNLAPRLYDDPPVNYRVAAVLDRRFSGSICVPIPE
jgi:hypothetical protein